VTPLLTPNELPKWVPGKLLESSEGLGWHGVGLRGYRYAPLDVSVPAMSDFVVVSYRRGSTTMARRFEGRWTRAECHPGDMSLLTRSQASHWHWTQEIEVAHAYLADTLLTKLAAEVLGRSIADVRLHDLLKARDPVVSNIVNAMSQEAAQQGIGGPLYMEALSTQLAVHLLRHYASVTCRESAPPGGLSPAVCQRLIECIECRLHEGLTLEDLAGIAGLGAWTFGRRFRQSFGKPAHAYIIEQRVRRAQRLLAHGSMPVKAIASACGFADQAHLTRVMHRRLGVTPAALRKSAVA
jgi:AraC family transcriptional regulator